MVAVVGTEDIAIEQFTRLFGIMPHAIEVVELRTEVDTLVEVARKEEVDLVFLVHSSKAFVVGNARIGGGGVEETHVLRRIYIRLVSRSEDVIDLVETVEIDTRLNRRHEAVAVVCRGDGIVVLHAAHRVVEVCRIGELHGVGDSRRRRQLPSTDNRLDSLLFGGEAHGSCQQKAD